MSLLPQLQKKYKQSSDYAGNVRRLQSFGDSNVRLSLDIKSNEPLLQSDHLKSIKLRVPSPNLRRQT